MTAGDAPGTILQGTPHALAFKAPAQTFMVGAGQESWLATGSLELKTAQSDAVEGDFTLGLVIISSTNPAGAAERVIIETIDNKRMQTVFVGPLLLGDEFYRTFPTNAMTCCFRLMRTAPAGGNYLVIENATITTLS